MSDQSKLGLGRIITTEQNRDAVHVAVAPTTAAERLLPGAHVNQNGEGCRPGKGIGVVDPFLTEYVERGDKFWLFLYPGSITSLRHEWTHPAFAESTPINATKAASEEWMRKWAKANIHYDYTYGDDDLTEEQQYQFAIKMPDNMSVGANQSARDEINNEWWNHWEIITGKKGQRDEYFSCGC